MSVDTNSNCWGSYPDDIEGNVLLEGRQKTSVEDIAMLVCFCHMWSKLASHAEVILKPTAAQRKEMQGKYVTKAAFQRLRAAALPAKRPEDEYVQLDFENIAQKVWDLSPKMALVFKGIGIGTRRPNPNTPGGVQDTPFRSCPQM